jgi:hypothetical protein
MGFGDWWKLSWREKFLGRNPESLSRDELLLEVRINRWLLLFVFVAALFMLVAIHQQKQELLSCWNGDLLWSCRSALGDCLVGFKNNIDLSLL